MYGRGNSLVFLEAPGGPISIIFYHSPVRGEGYKSVWHYPVPGFSFLFTPIQEIVVVMDGPVLCSPSLGLRPGINFPRP